MKRNELSIVVDFKVYLYLFEPIIRTFLNNDIYIYLYVPDGLASFSMSKFDNNPNLKILSLTEIKKKHKFRFAVHRALMLLFTRTDFSYQFQKKRNQTTVKSTGMTRFLLNLSKLMPKIPNNKINMFLSRISGFMLVNPFKTNNVMVGSLNASAELLGASNQKIITVMESWDHAVKQPCGHKTDQFWGWNIDLCHDWKNTQSCDAYYVFHPLKLRYANEVYKRNIQNINAGQRNVKVLYPVASTDKFSIGVLVEIEKKLINELIHITQALGWELCVKPRPNGREGEFDYAKNYEHVTIGTVSHGDITNPADYYYSELDNQERFNCLDGVDLVINAFTTFGLDAVAAGIPVMQLDLRESVGYENSCLVYNNHHIKKYLLSSENITRPVQKSLEYTLNDNEQKLLETAINYQVEMERWLYKYNNCNEAINKMKDVLFK